MNTDMEQRMNILVTGANGQLGREVRLLARESGHRFVFTDVVEAEGEQTTRLDITDAEAVRRCVRENDIQVVINCAAYTNVDAAEADEERADLLNATAPHNLAAAISEAGGLLVHISTDYVFGAEPYNTPCREDQQGTPTGAYGRTKLHGEQLIRRSGADHVIIRTAWLYSEYGRNFLKTMLQLTATRPTLKVVFDQVGTPTYALDLARAVMTVVNDYATFRAQSTTPYPRAGVYHYSNEGVCSWYDFAKTIAAEAGHTQCDIQPCHSSEFPSPVARPAYSVLDKTKIKETFGLRIPYWTDSLKKCLGVIGQQTTDNGLPQNTQNNES